MTAFAHLAAPALGASLALGLVAVTCFSLVFRICRLERAAAARFTLWFAAFLALALAVPLFMIAGASRLERVPQVAVESVGVPSVAGPRAVAATSAATAFGAQTNAVDSEPHKQSVLTNLSNLWVALSFIWIVGALASFARVVVGLVRLKMLTERATPLALRFLARGPVRVLCAQLFSVPIAVGYRRPAIVLPSALLELEQDADLENVILHELEHLRRFDDVSSLLQALCGCILWFNPFAQYIARRLALEREMACDEAVVAHTGKRRNYAATLWKIAASAADGLTPSFLSAFASRSHTVPRLDNLLSASGATSRRTPAIALAAALGVTAALLGSAVAAPALVYPSESIAAFSSVRFADGSALAIGGRGLDGAAAKYAQLYDRAGRRIALIPMRVARWSATATLLRNGNVLVSGGVTNSGVTATAELYDRARRMFHLAAPMSVARVGHTATLLRDGRVLVAAGERSPGRYVAETEIYDPASGRFNLTADGAGRVNQTALLIDNGSVLMFGGRVRNRVIGCAIIYDPHSKAYRDAGRLVAASPDTLTFKLPTGRTIRHYIRSA